ncbi:MAG: lactate 2-monooxygenase [Chloroflexota bacterium]|jgi:isopentenyl diphosphate isomerase/L-lactate dehydrogenase-like FMN-dependent dehydrogenase|nr:lactate 2-monooxygenase [Chloroflexota bacterium]
MTQVAPLAGYQSRIYLEGLSGRLPGLPLTYEALEQRAERQLTRGAFGYVAGGAGAEDTMRANREAFRRWRIVPRMLRDVSRRDLGTTLLGTAMPAPVMLAPVGVQSIVHPDAEVAVARAAAATGVPMVLSTASSRSLEEVAEAQGDAPRWFQLYWPRDPDLAASLLGRAERAGYGAIVVTLDTWLLAWRPRDLELAYLPFLHGEGIANYLSDPVFRAALPTPPEEDMAGAVRHFLSVFSDPSVTWTGLSLLRESTRLPIVLKGILHPDDARRAVDHGVDGILVSNHGGRQVDGSIAALDALPGVVDAVPESLPVLFDSGIRSAADAFVALALGARAVLLGRPYIWALAVAGEDGVAELLRGFLAELDLTLALSGHTRPDQLGREALVRG